MTGPHDFDEFGICTHCECTEEEVEDGLVPDECPGPPDKDIND